VPRGHAALAYVFEGEVSFGEASDDSHGKVAATRLVVLGDGDLVRVSTGEQPARLLLLSGKPLGEPVARYGPFVMNTAEEIHETLRELRDGTFIRR
jgi:quercetin 2,3-dioxygenase